MKNLLTFLAFIFFLQYTVGQSVPGPTEEDILVRIKTQMSKKTVPEISAHKDETSPTSKNSFSINDYWRSVAVDSLDFGLTHQSRFNFQRREAFGNAGVSLGATLYLNDWKPDAGRSGAHFSFDRERFLEALREKYASDYLAGQNAALESISEMNPRIAAARKIKVFNDYLEVMNSSEYRDYYDLVSNYSDSLDQRKGEVLSEQDHEWIERKEELHQFAESYRKQLSSVNSYPAEFRNQSGQVLDSCQRVVSENGRDLFRRRMLRSGKTSTLQKMLLLTNGFSIGNTRLGDDGLISAGLPIRGGSFIYDDQGIRLDIRHGRRIVSNRFLPRDGITFHDRNRNYRLSTLALTLRTKKDSDYTFSALLGRELPGNNDARFPRINRVLGLQSKTKVGNKTYLLAGLHHAETRLVGRGVANPDSGILKPGNQISARVGGGVNLKSLELDLSAFYRGPEFQSFGNPYLFGDFRGLDARWRISAFNDRLTGAFSLAYGGGTMAETKNDRRWQAQGMIRGALGKTASLGLLVSPNVFRYSISGKESFSESSIYRLDLQLQGARLAANISLTNMDQGRLWNDTTTASRMAFIRISGRWICSEKTSISIDAQESLTAPATELFYAINLSYDATFRLSGGPRYDRYRYEKRPTWGAALDLELPISKQFRGRVSLVYRKTDTPGILSQQGLEGQF